MVFSRTKVATGPQRGVPAMERSTVAGSTNPPISASVFSLAPGVLMAAHLLPRYCITVDGCGQNRLGYNHVTEKSEVKAPDERTCR